MTDAPNYNDGKWHGWNGGECPVHPKTVVDVRYLKDKPPSATRLGEEWVWSHTGNIGDIVAFCVIKEHREPREWWAVGTHMLATKDEAEKYLAQLLAEHPGLGFDKWEPVLVREVIA